MIVTGRLERQDRKMKFVTAIFNRFSRGQAPKPDAFDARLVSMARPANNVNRRSRVAAPSLFRCTGQSAA